MVARTLAIFVIVALSGVPASVALCEGWCPTIEASTVASSGTACHEMASSSDGPRLAGREHGCDHPLSSASAVVDIRPSGSAARALVAEVEFSNLLFGRTATAFAFGDASGSPPRSAVPPVTFLRI
jgi:hypothetical protein